MVKRVIDLEARRRIVEILEHTLSYRDAKLIVAIPMITVYVFKAVRRGEAIHHRLIA